MDKSLIAVLLLIPLTAWGQTHTMPGSNVVPSGASLTIQSGASITAAGGSTVTGFGSGGGAPTTATYITQTADAGLSAEVPLSGLATGLLKSTITTGALTTITDSSANWNTAYTERAQWDGGSTNLVAATGRTSLGGTTVGQSFFTLTNPGAITFPEISAGNAVSAKTAAQLKTDLALTIGTDVQAFDSDLTSWAAITRASGFDTFATTSSSANLRTLLTDENGTGAALFNAATSPDFTTSVTIGSVAVPTISSTSTLTNKRINPRVTTITSNATLSPSADNDDVYAVSALATAITTISAPTGTPVDGQKLIIRVISDSSIRAISGWNAIYRFSTALPAPSTTVASSTHTWGFMYNTTSAKWDCLAQATNP